VFLFIIINLFLFRDIYIYIYMRDNIGKYQGIAIMDIVNPLPPGSVFLISGARWKARCSLADGERVAREVLEGLGHVI